MNNHSVGSAPAINPSVWDRQQPYMGESPKASSFHHVSLGNMRISGGSQHSVDFVPHNIIQQAGRNCVDLPIAPRNVGLQSHHQQGIMFSGRGHMIPVVTSFDPSNERTRNRRNDGASSQVDNKKHYELDIDRIMRGEDIRTTLMIKNIPNKYVIQHPKECSSTFVLFSIYSILSNVSFASIGFYKYQSSAFLPTNSFWPDA